MSTKKFPKKLQDEIDANKNFAVGYRRVSDEKQRERASMETQKAEMEKYCRDNSLKLLKVYEDECMSGLSYENRIGFLQMIKDIKPGYFILTFEVSRLNRNTKNNIDLWDDLVEKKGCTLVSLSQGIDSRNKGSGLVFGIQSLLAKEESDKISDRVKSNMNRLSEEGQLICRPAFGYKRDPLTRLLEPETEQQEVIKLMEAWHLCGVPMSQIANRLNKDDKGKVLNNNKLKPTADPKFHTSTVSIILHNYHFIKDDKTPKFPYPERVANWNVRILSKTNNIPTIKEENVQDDIDE